MNHEMEALLIAGILGLFVGWLTNMITGDRAIFLYTITGILGAFMAGYPTRGIGSMPLLIKTASAAIGALALVFLISRTL